MSHNHTKTEEKIASKPGQLISKDMTIGDVVAKFPSTANIMMSHGLHCIGCSVNPYETIENGALGHGMPQEEIDSMVEELNKVASAPPRPKDQIIFTERAVNKVKELAVSENKIDQALRIEVKPEGCDNWQYFMDFAPAAGQDEKEKTITGLKVFISDASEKALLGAEVDYLITPEGEGFKIDNPNKPSTCECGGCAK